MDNSAIIVSNFVNRKLNSNMYEFADSGRTLSPREQIIIEKLYCIFLNLHLEIIIWKRNKMFLQEKTC